MESHRKHWKARKLQMGLFGAIVTAAAALAIAAGSQTAKVAYAQTPETPSAQLPAPEPEIEYGEFLARPEELANVPTNDIARSLRLNGQAMRLGRQVYDAHCASCHGADLKGLRDKNTPDLTDSVWRFSGDDLATGGIIKYPSDVEWTVRYGIRSGHPNARGLDVDMLAYDPQYRNERDIMDFGTTRYLTEEEVEDVAEYVLQISGQQHDPVRAARGAVLFYDNAKGNCFDCHGDDATGNPAFGSTDLTRPDLYLWGSDRASILESINRGRAGVMPAFNDTLRPEEIKAVSVFVLAHSRQEPFSPPQP